MKLKRDCARTIRFDPWRSTGFQPANGSCSIICRWSSTFSIGKNAPSTAWRVFGATRRCYSGKQPRRADRRYSLCQTPVLWDPLLAGRYNYFGDTAGAAGAGLAAACGGLTPISSTSKIKVELGAISGPTLRSPYARFAGTTN